ncbi:MAG: hypothetical protein AAFQ62_08260 [Pseudomonadota bacterium]
MIAADTHAHFYSAFDRDRYFDAAQTNLASAIEMSETPTYRLLVLTDGGHWDAFGDLLRDAENRTDASRWKPTRTHEASSVRMINEHGDEIFVLAGAQIVTSERIEVLWLAERDRVADGINLDELLQISSDRDIPTVLPWGVGKWLGKRAKRLASVLTSEPRPGLFIGDIHGRPRVWGTPKLFTKARRAGFRSLCGTDPLPLRWDEARVGRFGTLLQGTFDPDVPAASFRNLLNHGDWQVRSFGRRQSTLPFLRNQIGLRLNK